MKQYHYYCLQNHAPNLCNTIVMLQNTTVILQYYYSTTTVRVQYYYSNIVAMRWSYDGNTKGMLSHYVQAYYSITLVTV